MLLSLQTVIKQMVISLGLPAYVTRHMSMENVRVQNYLGTLILKAFFKVLEKIEWFLQRKSAVLFIRTNVFSSK